MRLLFERSMNYQLLAVPSRDATTRETDRQIERHMHQMYL